MSWLRAAVNHAMNNAKEGGEKANLSRSVRDVANTVVKQALATQDRPHQRNLKSFKHTVKGLDELSVSCRGPERVLLLRRWLVALKEVEKITRTLLDINTNDNNYGTTSSNTNTNTNDDHDDGNYSDEELLHDDSIDPPRKPTLIYYYDPGVADEPMNFRDVFLTSKALEGLTLSMIIEAPNEEENALLLELFRLCLTGGKEEHCAVLKKIQDLSKAFSSYKDEVLVKREELLRYAQSAISGLKINADIERIDFEACNMKETLDKMMSVALPSKDVPAKSSEGIVVSTLEDLGEARMQIRLLFELKDLLLRKKSLSTGDSPQLHAEKVDKLKILSESLVSSTSKAENRVLNHRSDRDDAIKFRKAKVEEVVLIEKDLVVEILELEKQRTELEDRLQKVNTLLANACARLNNAREEREQYEDSNSQIFIQLKLKEDELGRSVGSCKAEADAVNSCIQFLEDTWALQSSYTQRKEKQANGDLERYGDHFVNLVIHLLSSYKEEIGRSITRFRVVVENLRSIHRTEVSQTMRDQSLEKINASVEDLEDEYLHAETQFKTTFGVVESMKKKFYSQNCGMFRKDEEKVEKLFQALQNIKEVFESIERPPTPTLESPSGDSGPPSGSRTPRSPALVSGPPTDTPGSEKGDRTKSSSNQSDMTLLGAKEELEKSGLEPKRSMENDSQLSLSPVSPQYTALPTLEDQTNISDPSPGTLTEEGVVTAGEVPKPEKEAKPESSSAKSDENKALEKEEASESRTGEDGKERLTEKTGGETHQSLISGQPIYMETPTPTREDITKSSFVEREKATEAKAEKISEEKSAR